MLLLRHASAGERLSTPSLDHARRLVQAGRVQARLLPRSLSGHAVERILSSPHARCVETVVPLADARGLVVECRDELTPDGPIDDLLSFLDELSDDTLLCTHREVFERLFGGDVTCEKGGAWLVERRGGRLAAAAYLPPPSSMRRVRVRAAAR